MISKHSIETLKQTIDILDVIGSVVELKKLEAIMWRVVHSTMRKRLALW